MFFLKESVGPYRWSAVVIGFIGVIIMTQPSGEVYALGIIVAISAALLHACLQIILRYLGRYESPETISFYFFVGRRGGSIIPRHAKSFPQKKPDHGNVKAAI